MAARERTTATGAATLSPPSPPLHRRKSPDPFDNIPQLTPRSSPGGSPEPEAEQEENSDSLLQRIVISPFLFVSFLFSLVLVERRDRAYRVAEHSNQASSSFWARYSPFSWMNPEPYQEPEDSTWQSEGGDEARNPATDGRPHSPGGNKQPWFRGKKHRKMVRMELDDAVRGWGKVQAAMVAAGVITVGGAGWAVTRWVR